MLGWVAPFGDPGINDRSHLPLAFRSVPRPSSPLSAKASTRCPCPKRLIAKPVACRDKPRKPDRSHMKTLFGSRSRHRQRASPSPAAVNRLPLYSLFTIQRPRRRRRQFSKTRRPSRQFSKTPAKPVIRLLPIAAAALWPAALACCAGGGERDRTVDLLLAKQALSQLSYTPAAQAASLAGWQSVGGPGRI